MAQRIGVAEMQRGELFSGTGQYGAIGTGEQDGVRHAALGAGTGEHLEDRKVREVSGSGG
jgi:hypothetical protein